MKNEIEYEIKSKMGAKCITTTALVELLNEELPDNKKTTVQNLTNKLKRGSIKYKDVKKIADLIGYEIVWKEIE